MPAQPLPFAPWLRDLDFRSVLPVAGAIAVFGMVYGATSAPVLGVPLTLVSSVLIFSGAAQFSMVGLLASGASAYAVLWTVAVLSLRHLPMGAMIRPRVGGSTARRWWLAWFLIDESVGLALTTPASTATTLAGGGLFFYLGWLVGTVIGVAGAGVSGLEAVATAVFPVLFIGLASIMARGRDVVVRTFLAALITAGLLVVWPPLGGLAPIIAATLVALPEVG